MVIDSEIEFFRLCDSKSSWDANRSFVEEASLSVWLDIVEKFPERRIDVAQNKTISEEVVRALVVKGDATVRSILAEKRRLPSDLFSVLSTDKDEIVRKKVAANQKIPFDVLKVLCSDSVEGVAAVANYNLQRRLGK